MKKLLTILSCIFILSSCAKPNNDASGFSKEEKEVLSILEGTWKYESIVSGNLCSTEIITFSIFDAPQTKILYDSGIEYNICGIMLEKSSYGIESPSISINECYFYINPNKSQIIKLGINKSDSNKVTAVYNPIYDYIISKDGSAISLRNIKLSELTRTTYIRQD